MLIHSLHKELCTTDHHPGTDGFPCAAAWSAISEQKFEVFVVESEALIGIYLTFEDALAACEEDCEVAYKTDEGEPILTDWKLEIIGRVDWTPPHFQVMRMNDSPTVTAVGPDYAYMYYTITPATVGNRWQQWDKTGWLPE